MEGCELVFKRRKPLGWAPWLRGQVYPRGGFGRAIRYVVHRMRRLPDQPHRVARGVFAGSVVGFLPLPGLQFLAAWGAARLIRGNVLASLLATFNTNPVTTPVFAVLAMSLGHWIMGIEAPLNAEYIGRAFGHAGRDLWFNVMSVFDQRVARWDGLLQFWREVYLPYFVGALGPAVLISTLAYWVTIPLVEAYQKSRAAKATERSERRRSLGEAVAAAAAKLKRKADPDTTGEGDDGPGTP